MRNPRVSGLFTESNLKISLQSVQRREQDPAVGSFQGWKGVPRRATVTPKFAFVRVPCQTRAFVFRDALG